MRRNDRRFFFNFEEIAGRAVLLVRFIIWGNQHVLDAQRGTEIKLEYNWGSSEKIVAVDKKMDDVYCKE